MPVNIKVIHPKDFIQTTATGDLDFAVSKQTLLDIASQIEQPGAFEILLDVRQAEKRLSLVDIYELVGAMAADPSLRRSKAAVLTSIRDIPQSDFFETVAANRGLHTRVFTDFEEAITWLVMQESS